MCESCSQFDSLPLTSLNAHAAALFDRAQVSSLRALSAAAAAVETAETAPLTVAPTEVEAAATAAQPASTPAAAESADAELAERAAAQSLFDAGIFSPADDPLSWLPPSDLGDADLDRALYADLGWEEALSDDDAFGSQHSESCDDAAYEPFEPGAPSWSAATVSGAAGGAAGGVEHLSFATDAAASDAAPLVDAADAAPLPHPLAVEVSGVPAALAHIAGTYRLTESAGAATVNGAFRSFCCRPLRLCAAASRTLLSPSLTVSARCSPRSLVSSLTNRRAGVHERSAQRAPVAESEAAPERRSAYLGHHHRGGCCQHGVPQGYADLTF